MPGEALFPPLSCPLSLLVLLDTRTTDILAPEMADVGSGGYRKRDVRERRVRRREGGLRRRPKQGRLAERERTDGRNGREQLNCDEGACAGCVVVVVTWTGERAAVEAESLSSPMPRRDGSCLRGGVFVRPPGTNFARQVAARQPAARGNYYTKSSGINHGCAPEQLKAGY